MKNFREKLSDEEFTDIIDERIKSIYSSLHTKGKEYRRNNDALFNFNEGSKDLNITREKFLLHLVWKQICSVKDIINDLDDEKLPTEYMIDEKIGDVINYCILLEASLKQRIK